jgi:hypothetical protein
MILARVLVVVAFGCLHESLSHPDIPPLPASTGTPVSYLVDAAGDLHLNEEQLGKLKEIDAGLAVTLAPLDKRIAAAGKTKEAAGSAATPAPMPRMHGGGMRGSGGPRTGSRGRRSTARAAGSGHQPVPIRSRR